MNRILYSIFLAFIALIISSCSKDDELTNNTSNSPNSSGVYFSTKAKTPTWVKNGGFWEYEVEIIVHGINANKVYSIGAFYDSQESRLNVPESCSSERERNGVTSTSVYLPVGPNERMYYKAFVYLTDGTKYYSTSCAWVAGPARP